MGQFTHGRLSVPSALTSTSQKCSVEQWQLGKRQGEEQQEAKAQTPAHQGKGWKAATRVVEWQGLQAASAFLLFKKAHCKKTGFNGGTGRVGMRMSVGAGGRVLGQQYLP